MDKTAVLEAINLTKRYENGVLAVDNLNLNIYPGEIYVLLGTNGAGKCLSPNTNVDIQFCADTTKEKFILFLNHCATK